MSNTKLKAVNIKGKEYVEVNERLKCFRSQPQYKNYSLESEIIELNEGIITIKAIIRDENGIIKATGLAQEKESSSYINKTSFVENCETSAWGRALGNLGIGIDTSIATAEEVQNAITNQEKPKKQAAAKPVNESSELPQGFIGSEENKTLKKVLGGAQWAKVMTEYKGKISYDVYYKLLEESEEKPSD